MAIPQPLLDMCRDSVVIEEFLGVDAYGAVSLGTGTTYAARIVGTHKTVQNNQGHDVVTSVKVILAADVEVDLRSRVTLSRVPTGCLTQPQIRSVEYYPDAVSGGLSHATLYLG
jgi:hypothetical protein